MYTSKQAVVAVVEWRCGERKVTVMCGNQLQSHSGDTLGFNSGGAAALPRYMMELPQPRFESKKAPD